MTARINFQPCDECGCYLVDDFACGCGAVHEPYCQLCGRFPGATSPVSGVKRCDKGPTPHKHTAAEKMKHLEDEFDRMKKQMSDHPRQDDETISSYIERMQKLRLSTVVIN